MFVAREKGAAVSLGFQLARRQAEAYESFTSEFMEGSAQLLVLGAGIESSDVVLDLACGTGFVARHVVPLVSAGGRVIGADINSAMIDVARNKLGDAVEWVETPCDDLPFDDDTFTHVICQQGFQFFPDPAAAMAQVLRVLQAGGTLLASVWATPGHNPYIEAQLEMLAAIDPSLVPSVQRATPADADEFLRSIAESAGFIDVELTLLEHTVLIAELQPWFLAQTASTPWGPTLAALTDTDRLELARAMETRLDEYAVNGVHRVPFGSYRLEAHAPEPSGTSTSRTPTTR